MESVEGCHSWLVVDPFAATFESARLVGRGSCLGNQMSSQRFIRISILATGLWVAVLALGAGRTNSVIISPISTPGFGSSLAGGDFNGDGRGDLMIAETDPEASGVQPGTLRLHFGTFEGIESEPAVTLSGLVFDRIHQLKAEPGSTDFDGDGCADLALTSRRWVLPDGTVTTHPTAVILSGRALADGRVETLWVGEEVDWADSGLPFALGDLNHDGLAEFAFAYISGTDRSEVVIVWGIEAGSGAPRVIRLAGESGPSFGNVVAPWPDRDGDGVRDLVIGAPNTRTRVPGGGAVEFWALDADLSARRLPETLETPMPPLRPPSDHREQLFGTSIAVLEAHRGARTATLLAASPWAEDGDVDEGVVRGFRADAPGRLLRERFLLEGDRAYGLFGLQLDVVGDINGDGLPDALIAAPEMEHGQIQEGLVFLFAGKVDGIRTKPVWAFQGESTRARFGTSLAALGDVNGDSYADFAVSAPGYRAPGGRLGQVQVFYGSPEWPVSFEPIRWGKPRSRRLADWWLTRWWWEQAGLAFVAFAFAVASGVVAQRQWQKRTVVLVERRDSQARIEERERLARNLHDDVGPHLSRIHVIAEHLNRAGGPNGPVTRVQSDQLSATARDLRGALEELVTSLRKGPDSMEALMEILSRQADEFFSGTGVRCLQRIPIGLPTCSVPESIRSELVPCVREALNNVLRHSKAREVWVRITWDAPRLSVCIEDDGVGFRESKIRPGNGLANLRARMHAVNGVCAIETAPGRGCRVQFQVELPVEAGPVPEAGIERPSIPVSDTQVPS